MSNAMPTRKVGAGALGGAVGTIGAIVAKAAWPEVDVTGLEGAAAVIAAFGLSYIIREREVRG